MKNLKSLLKEYVPEPGDAGDLGLDEKNNELRRDQLRFDLLAVSEKNKYFFFIGIGMLVVLFIAALVLIWLWRSEPNLIAAVFGATGISVTGIIATLFSHWKEKSRVDMLLVLLSGIDDVETLKTVIGTLASGL